MADVTMPRLSDTMEEGTIASWLKKPGEEIKKGDVIAQIETDKATMDLTAFEAGTLQEILAPEGTTVAIGKPVARIGSATKSASGSSTRESSASPKDESSAPPTEASEPPAAEATGAEKPRTTAARKNATEAPEPTASPPDVAANAQASSSGARQSTANGEASPSGAGQATANGEASPSGAGQATANGEASPSDARVVADDGDGANGKVRASPMARHMAAEHGLDLAALKGSGPQGRVIRADVQAALEARPSGSADGAAAPGEAAGAQGGGASGQGDAASAQGDGVGAQGDGAGGGGEGGQPVGGAAAVGAAQSAADGSRAADGDERVNLSQMRRTIARRMAESTRTVPHFFLTTTVDAADLVALRKQILDQTADAGIKITFNDMVLKAAALALRKVPDVNVSFAEDSLIRHQHIHIGVAVATERGLIVPVVRDADQKSLGQVARETRELAERASSGKLQPADYTGGTFTISNLGMFGIEQFNAVINPPEAAILAIGAIAREPAEHDGQIVLRERMKLTLSVDHRALDGATGARYLQALKQLLEKPMLLLV